MEAKTKSDSFLTENCGRHILRIYNKLIEIGPKIECKFLGKNVYIFLCYHSNAFKGSKTRFKQLIIEF